MSAYTFMVSGEEFGAEMFQPSLALLNYLADADNKTFQSRLAVGGVPPSENEREKEMQAKLQTFEQAVQSALLTNGTTGPAHHV